MNRLSKTTLLTLLTLTACNRADEDQISRYFVIDVPSSNTLVIGYQGEQQVRLCGVDVPPEKQAQAKQLLKALVEPFMDNNKRVFVTLVNTKQTRDVLAEVAVPSPLPDNPEAEKDLSSELLLAGLAKVSKDNCPNREVFLSAQEDAQERKVGIWSRKRY